jgi:hypothetical protein
VPLASFWDYMIAKNSEFEVGGGGVAGISFEENVYHAIPERCKSVACFNSFWDLKIF